MSESDQYASAAPAFADVVRGPLRLLLSGPGGHQILLTDPAGNLVELFQPARRPDAR
ncbi:hypothetical protein AB0J86_32870 [Micromonospora sp. NPDC049559]|uniref:VOC family protein n=1 Tax=Micromonospora sp. NPDC049559 TaxID=3155923 RepID=UPI003425C057